MPIVTQTQMKQVCIPVGCVPSASVAVCWGEWEGGVCTALGQAPLPLWTEWLTDGCKNITFPQLRLRTVMNRSRLILFILSWFSCFWKWNYLSNLPCCEDGVVARLADILSYCPQCSVKKREIWLDNIFLWHSVPLDSMSCMRNGSTSSQNDTWLEKKRTEIISVPNKKAFQ